MAATQIAVVQAGPVGVAGVPATVTPDAVNGNAYSNPGGALCVLSVINTGSSAITVTFQLPNTPFNGFGSIGSTIVASVPATATRTWGLEPSVFNDASGKVNFIVSAATSVTASVTQYNRAFS